mmetsp:Transcript_16884/g.23839  ORF Transcript_16884/g.23839 Transcript_16884/m.23839 type:complete len:149 (+) Transcript_16884:150-596(+)
MMNTLTKRLAQTCISKIVHNPSIPKHSLRTSLFLTGNKPFVLSTLPSNTTRCMSSSSSSSSDNTQHEEWVKFQQSIAVDGFNTGQTTQVNTNLTKRRGGKQLRKRNEKEMELQKHGRRSIPNPALFRRRNRKTPPPSLRRHPTQSRTT